MRILLLCGFISLPGATLIQYVFNMESAFMDKLMTTPICIYSVLKAKYLLYCIFATFVLILFLPTIFWGIKLSELLSVFLLAIGLVYFLCFQIGRFNSKRFDLNGRAYYNWQGISVIQYIVGLLIFVVPMAIFYFVSKFSDERTVIVIASIVGLIFVLSNRIWLYSIARNFEKTKYQRLDSFRKD